MTKAPRQSRGAFISQRSFRAEGRREQAPALQVRSNAVPTNASRAEKIDAEQGAPTKMLSRGAEFVRGKAHRSPGTMAYRSYVEFAGEEQRRKKAAPRGGFRSDKLCPRDQKRPVILPLLSTSIFSAAGTLGRPGMVMMSPVRTTRKPAPAETFTLRTVMVKPSGAPSLV